MELIRMRVPENAVLFIYPLHIESPQSGFFSKFIVVFALAQVREIGKSKARQETNFPEAQVYVGVNCFFIGGGRVAAESIYLHIFVFARKSQYRMARIKMHDAAQGIAAVAH